MQDRRLRPSSRTRAAEAMRGRATSRAVGVSSCHRVLSDNHASKNQVSAMTFPIEPPVEPMLAQNADALPAEGEFLFEPKWDGFRAIAFRGSDDVYIQSRDLKPLDRYFPELHESLFRLLPPGCVVDGEIVIANPKGL